MKSVPHRRTPWPPILTPGRNCWTARAAVEHGGLLIDARDYYRAFYQTARQARRYILLAGWRFDSNVRLMRGEDGAPAGGDVRLADYLKALCAANPELRVYVLAWKYGLAQLPQWEWFQRRKFQRDGRGQIHFRYDGRHPAGAGHHHNLVVVDGCVAFTGGTDLCAASWDDRAHRAAHPERADCDHPPHPPTHELQTALVGPAAQELAAFFQTRWREAGGELELPPAYEYAPFVIPTVSLPAARVALSLNQAATPGLPTETFQIRRLYLDAIASAQRLVYLENPCFSARPVYQVLAERMKAPDRTRLEVVLILPQRPEPADEARDAALRALREVARRTGHRLGVYYPAAFDGEGREIPVRIRSRMLLVDDRFLTVGSADLCTRGLGLDTELSASWEAARHDLDLVRALRRTRVNLLAEHCGLRGEPGARDELRRTRGLVDYLDRVARERAYRLRPLADDAPAEKRDWLRSLTRWGYAQSLRWSRRTSSTFFRA